ncbi:hypothetical protein Agub_g534 [Astrephomene gubernaculifera]|uniref:Uncharacterized protein n=1 Tax=Astrephomene gubernaculifera TaxID=47775 RepID=A0AAD3DDY1_9CHLO|nr:hypothetical protein Agub_g534 [Astrephomene gubernaculifera]
MGRPKGCPGGPGRPKATPESRKQYGKTSMSFSITELKVLNRMMRTPWWRTQMRNSGCCKCLKKEPKCQQVHHLFRFLASGFLDDLLVGLRDDLLELCKQLGSTVQASKLSERLREVADKLPPNVLGPDPSDDVDFAVQKAQKAEQKEYLRAESLDDESLEQELQHLQQRQHQIQQQIAAAQVQSHLQAQGHAHPLPAPPVPLPGHPEPQPPAPLLQQLGVGLGPVGVNSISPTSTTPLPRVEQQQQPHALGHGGGPTWLQMAGMPPPSLPQPPPAAAPMPSSSLLPSDPPAAQHPDELMHPCLADYEAAEAVLAALVADPQLHAQQHCHPRHSHHQGEVAAAAAVLQPSGASQSDAVAVAVDIVQGQLPCLMPRTPPVLPGTCEIGSQQVMLLPGGYAADPPALCTATAATAAMSAAPSFMGTGPLAGLLGPQPLVSALPVGFS